MSQDDFRFISGIRIFSDLPDKACRRLLECMTPISVKAGERFIRQGDEGDCLYLIKKGSCVVKIERGGEENTVAMRNPGDLVGEIAICTGEKRIANVYADTNIELWRLSVSEFDEVCLDFPVVRELVTEIVTRRFSESRQTPYRSVGKYIIADVIGEGDWSIVYKGVHEPLNKPVAVKMLKHTMAMNPDFLQRFGNEAKVVSRLNHQNIVRVHDIEYLYRTVFVVMEYLSGLSLQYVLDNLPRPSFSRILGRIIQIGQGLAYAHRRGIVHQDFKPANVFIEDGDIVKILDFGLVFPVISENNPSAVSLPHYTAPELIRGEEVDIRTDIYAWGVTAYEMVTGKKAFPGAVKRQIMDAVMTSRTPDPRLINPDTPPELSEFILRATRNAPSERYRNIDQALEALEALAQRHGLEGTPDITDFRLTQKALHESEIRFAGIFKAAEDAIFIKDKSLKYTHVNPAMLSLLGLEEEQVVGKTHREVFGPQSSINLGTLEERVLSGESVENEQTIDSPAGTITLSFIRFPIFTEEGEVIGICGIARDVTTHRITPVKSDRDLHSYPSPAFRRVGELLRSAAETDSSILFLGESGTGKDYLARHLHDQSGRARGPFMSINCASLSPQLVESELFGHEAGAFTGAVRRKRGLLELAEGGTIFLNEIGELTQSLQAKLLSFLDTKTFARVGGEQSRKVDARIVAATNRDLKAEVQAGNFRKDLYFRLGVFPITIPPLRERLEDLTLLVERIIEDLIDQFAIREPLLITPSALEKLSKYHWPGNIRELRNVLERAIIMSDKKRITSRDVRIMPDIEKPRSEEELYTQLVLEKGGSLYVVIKQAEKTLIEQALQLCSGNVTQAARRMGLTREQLKYRMRTLEVGRKGKTNLGG